MSTMITPTRPPHDATAPTDDEGHRRSERSGDVDAVADRTDGPPSAGPGDRSGAPPSSTRLRRFGGFFGRHRWLAALAVIVALAALEKSSGRELDSWIREELAARRAKKQQTTAQP